LTAKKRDRRTAGRSGHDRRPRQHRRASVLDPTILIPIGGEVAAAGKGGYAIGRAAVRVGAAGGASTALQEGALQATQETRTAEESALNIGASVVLGGLLGGGGANLLSRAASTTRQSAALHDIVTAQPGSVGAAAVEHATLADLTVAGTATERLAGATKAISPNLRANFRASAAAREASASSLPKTPSIRPCTARAASLGAAGRDAGPVDLQRPHGRRRRARTTPSMPR
jgi:hypothetical protein